MQPRGLKKVCNLLLQFRVYIFLVVRLIIARCYRWAWSMHPLDGGAYIDMISTAHLCLIVSSLVFAGYLYRLKSAKPTNIYDSDLDNERKSFDINLAFEKWQAVWANNKQKVAKGAIVIVLFIGVLIYWAMPSVNDVEKYEARKDVAKLTNLLEQTKDSDIFANVRNAAIKALVRVNTYDGYARLNMYVKTEKDDNLVEEIKKGRKEVLSQCIANNANYIFDEMVPVFVEQAKAQKDSINEFEVYRVFRETLEDVDSEKNWSRALVGIIGVNLEQINNGNERKIVERIKFINELPKIPVSVNGFLTICKKYDSMQDEKGKLLDSLKANANEISDIKAYFDVYTDDVIRDELKEIYKTKGQKAAIDWWLKTFRQREKKINRYFAIPRENQEIQNEINKIDNNLTNLRWDRDEELKYIMTSIKKYCKGTVLPGDVKFDEDMRGKWDDSEGNVLNITENKLDGKVLTEVREESGKEEKEYCFYDNGDLITKKIYKDFYDPYRKALKVDGRFYYQKTAAVNRESINGVKIGSIKREVENALGKPAEIREEREESVWYYPQKKMGVMFSNGMVWRIALERDSLECFDESRLRADQSREDFARYYNTELKTLWQGLIPVGWMRIGVGEYIWFEDGSKGNMRWFNLFMGQYVELNSYSGGSYSG